jgi:hypothetical protein
MKPLRALSSVVRTLTSRVHSSAGDPHPHPEPLEPRRLLAALGGFVYVDLDNDGVRDTGEAGIAGVTVTLTGKSLSGSAVTRSVKSGSDGLYAFFNIPAGTYTIKETQPSAYADGKESIGRLGGKVTANDVISGIYVPRADSCSGGYNFGERPIAHQPPPKPAPTVPLQRDGTTATIGFWQNKNGQALLRALNGGANATQLGNWLAMTFPRLYGGEAGAVNLAGKTNAQVADHYKTVFRAKGGPKLEAQVLNLAFAVYVTDSDLAGTVATRYGFKVSAGGTGSMTWNVGKAGAAVGVANGTTLTVMQILQGLSARASGGVVWAGSHGMRSVANDLVDAINRFGDRH